jgi:hypothetical protein
MSIFAQEADVSVHRFMKVSVNCVHATTGRDTSRKIWEVRGKAGSSRLDDRHVFPLNAFRHDGSVAGHGVSVNPAPTAGRANSSDVTLKAIDLRGKLEIMLRGIRIECNAQVSLDGETFDTENGTVGCNIGQDFAFGIDGFRVRECSITVPYVQDVGFAAVPNAER